jgi:hypothetical protein
MAKVDITVEGMPQMMAAIARVVPAVRAAYGVEIRREADAIMARSKSDFVPIETGDLRDSGEVIGPSGADMGVELSYGSDTVEYAFVVHEDLTAHHEHGGAKYLEIPVNEAQEGMEGRLAAAMGQTLERQLDIGR